MDIKNWVETEEVRKRARRLNVGFSRILLMDNPAFKGDVRGVLERLGEAWRAADRVLYVESEWPDGPRQVDFYGVMADLRVEDDKVLQAIHQQVQDEGLPCSVRKSAESPFPEYIFQSR